MSAPAASRPAPRSLSRPVDQTGAEPRARRVRLLIVFFACVVIVNALVGEKGFLETLRAREEYLELAGSIGALRAENARLREEARRLREDPRTIESIAREELGLIKPGELLFIIRDAVPPPSGSPTGTRIVR